MTGMTDATERLPPLAGSALRRAVREVVGRHLDLDRYQLSIFGSEAQGTARPGSDVDIGLLGPDPVPPHVVQRIRDDLEALRTLRLFDVVDLRRADARFRHEVSRTAEHLRDEDA